VSEEIPQPTGRSTGRLRQTVADMVRSLAVVLGVVAIVLLVTWRPQPDPINVIDVAPYAQVVTTQATFPALRIPASLTEYRPTSARWEPTENSDGQRVWFLGYVTPNGEYLQISQSATMSDLFVDEQTAGGVAGDVIEIDGQQWQQFETDDRRSLVQRDGQVTTIVSGTQSWDELATSAAILVPVS
jgi:hypothetical protein